MASTAEVLFRPSDAGAAPAARLIEAMIVELEAFYGRIDGEGAPSAAPADFAPPRGRFLVGWVAGGEGPAEEPVACGGLKPLDGHTAEIKRMYVMPAWRGRGLASALLAALEDVARELGYVRVRLDTGPRQPLARGLYERRGYRSVPDYNGNPHASFWGEKALGGAGDGH
jgi:GNAT superfamily N-acetyltransferase